MNIPKFVWIAFVLYVPIVIPRLLEHVVIYFMEVYSLEEHEAKETKFDFFFLQ